MNNKNTNKKDNTTLWSTMLIVAFILGSLLIGSLIFNIVFSFIQNTTAAIIMGVVIIILGIVVIHLDKNNIELECEKCKKTHTPKLVTLLIAPSAYNAVYTKCPKCNKRSWHNKMRKIKEENREK